MSNNLHIDKQECPDYPDCEGCIHKDGICNDTSHIDDDLEEEIDFFFEV